MPSGGWSRNENSCCGQPILVAWSYNPFLNACYRLALGRLGHYRTLLFFQLHRSDKIHTRLILLLPAAVVPTISGRFESVRHLQYGIIRLQENIDSRQVAVLYIVL